MGPLDSRDVSLIQEFKTSSRLVGGLEIKINKKQPFEEKSHLTWVVPPPRIPVANEGLGWDSLLKM